jgi:hypothetical protein
MAFVETHYTLFSRSLLLGVPLHLLSLVTQTDTERRLYPFLSAKEKVLHGGICACSGRAPTSGPDSFNGFYPIESHHTNTILTLPGIQFFPSVAAIKPFGYRPASTVTFVRITDYTLLMG